MINKMYYTQYNRPFSFIDRIYNFYFLDHKSNIILYLFDFILSMLYMIINVMLFRRNEKMVIYEGILLAAIIVIVIPIMYSSLLYDRKKEIDDKLSTFDMIFYRRTKTKSKSVRWKNLRRYKNTKVIYMTDSKMHSNHLCD